MNKAELLLSILGGWFTFSAVLGFAVGRVMHGGVGPEPLPPEGERLFAKPKQSMAPVAPAWHGAL